MSYLRAQAGLQAQAAAVPSETQELNRALAEARKLVETLEPDFLTRLLIETERRASRDPVFAQRLSNAREDLRWLEGQLLYLPALAMTQPPQAMAPELHAAAMSHNDWSIFCAVMIVLLVAFSK